MSARLNRLARRVALERGFGPVETAYVAPVVVVVLLLSMAAGRVSSATTALDSAAYQAARAASTERTSGAAQDSARATAQSVLSAQGLQCAPLEVQVDTSGFLVPAGEAAQVQVDITCAVPLGDLSVPGAPGTKIMTTRALSAIDAHRERQG